MSYWKVASFAQPSPIEVSGASLGAQTERESNLSSLSCLSLTRARPSPHKTHLQQILSKDAFTLEELLDEDDIIQECKSLNESLLRL